MVCTPTRCCPLMCTDVPAVPGDWAFSTLVAEGRSVARTTRDGSARITRTGATKGGLEPAGATASGLATARTCEADRGVATVATGTCPPSSHACGNGPVKSANLLSTCASGSDARRGPVRAPGPTQAYRAARRERPPATGSATGVSTRLATVKDAGTGCSVPREGKGSYPR